MRDMFAVETMNFICELNGCTSTYMCHMWFILCIHDYFCFLFRVILLGTHKGVFWYCWGFIPPWNICIVLLQHKMNWRVPTLNLSYVDIVCYVATNGIPISWNEKLSWVVRIVFFWEITTSYIYFMRSRIHHSILEFKGTNWNMTWIIFIFTLCFHNKVKCCIQKGLFLRVYYQQRGSNMEQIQSSCVNCKDLPSLTIHIHKGSRSRVRNCSISAEICPAASSQHISWLI